MRRVVAPKRDDEGNMVLDERGLPVFDGWRDALLDGGRDALAEHWADGAFERSKPLAGSMYRGGVVPMRFTGHSWRQSRRGYGAERGKIWRSGCCRMNWLPRMWRVGMKKG